MNQGRALCITKETITTSAVRECNCKLASPGSVLLSFKLSIGKVGIAKIPLFTNEAIAALPIRDKSKLNAEYLFWALQSIDLTLGLDRAAKGLTLNKAKLQEVQIPLPPLPDQLRIVAVLDKAEELRARRRSALALLDEFNQAIFIEMFGNPATNPKGWPKIVLGDVIHKASDGPHVSPSYVESGIPFLSTRHIRPGIIEWVDLKFISNEDAEVHWRKCRPERGDILYTKGGTTGLAAVVDFDEPFAVWVHVALLKTDKTKVESHWLENMLNSSFCYQQSQRLTHGIANHDLGLQRMVKIEMFLPPISLQREFARRLSVVEKLKTAHRAALSELDDLFASLQYRAFRGEL
jgi:type I restriction enzyme S subunit